LCQELIKDASFHLALLKLDELLAEKAREAGCECGGVVHVGNFPRKPRGGPEDLPAGYEIRFSFCCACDGCRTRVTPPSVRYLGRFVYLGAVVVLACVLSHGLSKARIAQLRALLGISVQTLERWRQWWRDTFPRSTFWREARARFMPSVDESSLPASLCDRFVGDDAAHRLRRVLLFLLPITTQSAGQASYSMDA
jgi:hypothetical protein